MKTKAFIVAILLGSLVFTSAVSAQSAFPQTIGSPQIGGGIPISRPIGTEDVYERTGPLRNLSVNVNYYLLSDYVYRGVVMTDYRGEGREKVSNQLDIGIECKFTESFGVGAKFFSSWFAGASGLYPGTTRNNQERRWTPYVFFDVIPIASRVSGGVNFYKYPLYRRGAWTAADPVLPGSGRSDADAWIQIEHNDAWAWRSICPDNRRPILNPFLYTAMNIDRQGGYMYLNGGIKHDFYVPGCPEISITPQVMLATDHRLISAQVGRSPTTTLLNLQYGVTLAYDFGTALRLPREYGSLIISGSLYYSQTLVDYIDDKLYGGLQVGWLW